uniref:Uncharacterized protein n=1 Tax=Meloidogyne javanica TaxID=6303 RepID=A0A915LE68_MELJA
KSANRLLSHLTNSSIESAPDGGSIFGHRPIRRQMSNAVYIYKHQLPNLPSNPPSPPLDPSTLKQQPLSATSSLAYPTKFRASVPAISIEKDENLHEGGREDLITFVDNKSTTAATADELMQMLMEDDGTDRPIIFTVFEAANIDGVRHLSSKSQQCIGIGGKCDVGTDCCGDTNIGCVGAWEPTKKKGTCKKTCDLVGAPCNAPPGSNGNCCNYCTNNKCSYVSDVPG